MWLFLLGALQEYLVTVNLYNGNLFSFVDEIIEYCLIDLFLLIIMCIRWKKHNIYNGMFIVHLVIGQNGGQQKKQIMILDIELNIMILM